MDLVQLLRTDGSGLDVVDDRVAPASGLWSPVGVMIHHTASRNLDVRGLQRGYSFPGPLCNVGHARDGTRHVITDGRANDSGMGSSVVLNDVRNDRTVTKDARERGLSDTVSGNPYFYDLEVVNDGVGQDYPPVQIESLAVTAAAICRAHGWGPNRVIHHRQWTRRKVDMSWRGDIVALVARLLNDQEDDVTPKQIAELADRVAGEVWNRKLQDGGTAGNRLAAIDTRTAKLLSRESVERVAQETGCDADALSDALAREFARRLAE